jgi:hypothetical protein
MISRQREELKVSEDALESTSAELVEKYEARLRALDADKVKVCGWVGALLVIALVCAASAHVRCEA